LGSESAASLIEISWKLRGAVVSRGRRPASGNQATTANGGQSSLRSRVVSKRSMQAIDIAQGTAKSSVTRRGSQTAIAPSPRWAQA
jgi:hypothetical protein